VIWGEQPPAPGLQQRRHGASRQRPLIDDVIPWGDVAAIADRVEAQLDAGADHVALQVLASNPARPPLAAWRERPVALLP